MGMERASSFFSISSFLADRIHDSIASITAYESPFVTPTPTEENQKLEMISDRMRRSTLNNLERYGMT
jgi:hypothetical protein